MNAAQLERMKKRREHFVPETPNCAEQKCWCGLCHCQRCQRKRQNRGPSTPGGDA